MHRFRLLCCLLLCDCPPHRTTAVAKYPYRPTYRQQEAFQGAMALTDKERHSAKDAFSRACHAALQNQVCATYVYLAQP